MSGLGNGSGGGSGKLGLILGLTALIAAAAWFALTQFGK